MSIRFIHLRMHTEYSLVDGIVRIKPLMQTCADLNMPAIAMTDQSNMFAAVKFYKAAMSEGIKPIIGSDLWLYNAEDERHPFHIVFLCQNQQGYKNLTLLISKAYQQGQQTGRPMIQYDWLNEEATSGLITLSAGVAGDIGHAIKANNLALADERLQYWQALCGDRFYLECHRTGREHEETYIDFACHAAQKHKVPLVATNDIRFIKQDDFDAHEARVCIHSGYILADQKRPHDYSEQQFLRTAEQMCELFADIPGACENSVEIAKRCNVEISLGQVCLPSFPIPEGETEDSYITAQSEKGLQERLEFLFDTKAADFLQTRKVYDERLALELGVIIRMGFPGYFLIVADFIQWAKKNGIPVGPGRGSGAGSLVAYVLGITDLDPIKYDLLFERFLNPERVSMPDFDVDFCMEKRDLVIDYVARTYGREAVSQIITYGTMAAKAVVRDVGRVLALPYGFVDKVAKLIPFELGITLDKALAQEPTLAERYELEEEVTTLIDLAKKLEGVVRNAGKHAGGVVIAPTKLTDFAPIYCEATGENVVTQFDKDDIEAVGLVKFDFLGLRTLTIIDWAVNNVNLRRRAKGEPDLNITSIPMDDAPTFDLLKACATTAVFQLESRGMKDLIKRLQPDSFEEITALVALFRPGPLQSGMVDDFIDRKHGRAKVEYPHPELATILSPTYGVILYQEQVMQIAQVLAGYTLGGADMLRRAMGKKKVEEMAKQREIFVSGSTGRGVDAKVAEHIFDLMEKFAGYGFNRSHSAAYALIAYQTAWLKQHYPAEFMAAVLSSDMDNTDKVVMLAEECKHMQLKLMPPHVNSSQYRFSVSAEGDIIYGLGAIKGVGEAAIQSVIDVREANGGYDDLFHFCRENDMRKVNRRVLEAFIRSGAMDQLGPNRASMHASLNKALKSAEQANNNRQQGMRDLFASEEDDNEAISRELFIQLDPWPEKVRLQGEKETLGRYVSGHPLQSYESELRRFTTAPIAKLLTFHNRSVVCCGLVVATRVMQTKKGDRMAIVTLDDTSACIDVMVFPEVYQSYHELIVKDSLIAVEGDVSHDNFSDSNKVISKRLLSYAQARSIYARYLHLSLNQDMCQQQHLRSLQMILQQHQKPALPVQVLYERAECRVILDFSADWRIDPTDELLGKLHELLGKEAVCLVYADDD